MKSRQVFCPCSRTDIRAIFAEICAPRALVIEGRLCLPNVQPISNDSTGPCLKLVRAYYSAHFNTSTDSSAADDLVTTYHTLLSATLSLWPSEHPLSPPAFTAFVKSMFLSLPSSSQVASSPVATALGELLIDTMRSIESQLDDVIAGSKATIAAQSEKEKENEQTIRKIRVRARWST